MLTAAEIINRYLSFFEARGHKRIANSHLVPQNDPTTLFTSSGMQPLVPYLLGEVHPSGTRLVNVQNSFRAQDFDEIGDNRHTTFFRMLGNWSLGDYFKEEQIPWFFEFLTDHKIGLGLDPKRLYVTVFMGDEKNNLPKDTDAATIWKKLFKKHHIEAEEREMGSEADAAEKGMGDGKIFYYDAKKNWWSRAGSPENMPAGEPGGPDTEVFYDFGTEHNLAYGKNCHPNCDCGRFMEIGNSVFMQYIKNADGTFTPLPKQNVDFGAGLERYLAASNDDPDMFKTNLFFPIIETIQRETHKKYEDHAVDMRMIVGHLIAAVFISNAGVSPSNTEQGYILRRSIRRALDSFYTLQAERIEPILESIIDQYKETDPDLIINFEAIKGIILEETGSYYQTREKAKKFIAKKYTTEQLSESHDAGADIKEISADDAFLLYTTHGLSPTQIKSLGYTFDDQAFAQKMKDHKDLSRAGGEKKFRGGLADHSERTIMGHTATHLLHKALRDVLGNDVHQSGSNITTERVRFDFNYNERLTADQMNTVQDMINEKIKENLPVHFELIPTKEAYEMGAIGLFMDTYGEKSKIYFIGDTSKSYKDAYSIEFCGGPHVDFTGKLKSVTINKQENLGKNQKRLYITVEG
jgi:alanyl-tRNA synthetase